VLFRGGAEERIRTKFLKDGHIDTVIGLLANLFYSTGIPVCILVLKKCKKPDDVLFINAAEHFVKGKRQNQLTEEHIAKIIETYQFRKEEPRYARRVEMEEIEKNDYNLNISRYISTAVGETEISLEATHDELVKIEKSIVAAKDKHNAFLIELGCARCRKSVWQMGIGGMKKVRSRVEHSACKKIGHSVAQPDVAGVQVKAFMPMLFNFVGG
jgi:type I restriction enzyme M protein